ncbi:MAG: hypothetical protein LCH62_16820, partial [Proteobacteria bacterium]|nr:hypothetical protein [Pseudomonadota bacterium]
MHFIIASDERPNGWVRISDANHWQEWLNLNVPADIHHNVRQTLISNLKHILVGLELKKSLILPHAQTAPGMNGVLFEPYFQTLIFEFCVGVFSVLEGLGASHWLSQIGQDGFNNPRVHRNNWRSALCAVYDPAGAHEL